MKYNKELNLNDDNYRILITGIFKLLCKVTLNNEIVYNNYIRNDGNPIKKIIFYSNNKRYEITIGFDYRPFMKKNTIIIINNIVCSGSKEKFIKLVTNFRERIAGSKYYNQQKSLLSIILYTSGSVVYFFIIFSIIQFITNDIYNLKNIVVSTIVFSTMMGFSRLKQFKNMEVNGIDEIELNQIVGNKNFI